MLFDNDHNRLREAQQTISLLENDPHCSLTLGQFDVLRWAVIRLTEELLLSKEPLTAEEMKVGQELAQRIAERNNNKETE
jgi:hypothetical protein